MARLPDWCVLVALIGGGQEIHDGEAGLAEWGRALVASGERWTVVASPEVVEGGESVAGHRLFEVPFPTNVAVERRPEMHLSVSVRSPRAQRLAEWVNAVLRLDAAVARRALGHVNGFRLAHHARSRPRGNGCGDLARADTSRDDAEMRAGLLASSGSLRHRAMGWSLTQTSTARFRWSGGSSTPRVTSGHRTCWKWR